MSYVSVDLYFAYIPIYIKQQIKLIIGKTIIDNLVRNLYLIEPLKSLLPI